MSKKTFVKRRHHYVWAHYLRSWDAGGGLFYVTPKGKVAQSNANGLSAELGFYKINSLDAHDIEYLSAWIDKSEPGLKSLHQAFLRDFFVRASLAINIASLPDGKLSVECNSLLFNSLENVHSNFENGARIILDRLSEGDFKSLEDDLNMLDFCCYLGHQLTRTKSFRDKTLCAALGNLGGSMEHRHYAELTKKNWWLVNFILGLNSGWAFYSSRHKANKVALINKTDVPFITSDNPVINVHSSVLSLSEGEAPVYMDLYFPISPKFACMINDSDDFNHLAVSLNEEDVEVLNAHIARCAYSTVYSYDRSSLACLQWKAKQIR